ncbi:MAG: S8 family serine peptidase, partial [Planctomycetota bacterium]
MADQAAAATRGDVGAADLNHLRRATATPNDELYVSQWHYPLINLPQAWDVTTGTSDTLVAVIDTGVVRGHPDLEGSLPTEEGNGYDFISSASSANDLDGIDPDWNDEGNPSDAILASSFHGTHVTGTIAAATNNQEGVAGINWNAQIMPLRVLGRGGAGSAFDIQQAVLYAAGLPNDSNTLPDRRADIMNLSLGGSGSSQAEQQIYTMARDAGVIIVAAAGNESSPVPSYPAAYDGVVSVSAVGPTKELAPYSNFGNSVDVAAPGGDMSEDLDGDGQLDGVLSTLSQDFFLFPYIYDYYQGTSMASPHVAGVASLMKGLNPDLTPAGFDALLVSGELTDDLGASGRDDRYGHGLINAIKAVTAGGGPGPVDPELVVTPRALNFGTDTTFLPVS